MAANSAIEWTDATVNFWWGCTKVGPGCDHCYAETWDARTGGAHWGVGVPRRKIRGAGALLQRLDNGYSEWAADAHCRIGNAKAFGLPVPTIGTRRRVFIQSMSDLFDLEVDLAWFEEAWTSIERCDRLDLQIVTKRISAVEKRLAAIGRTTWPKHAGLIVTVVNQTEADRDVPRLLELKHRFGISWVGLSCEPLLGPIALTPWLHDSDCDMVEHGAAGVCTCSEPREDHLDWVIVGGESGKDARPMHIDWPRMLRVQCDAVAAFFFKQWGEWAPHKPAAGGDLGGEVRAGTVRIVHPTGQSDVEVAEATGGRNTIPGSRYMKRVGKKAAGRLLDGREHSEFPEVRS